MKITITGKDFELTDGVKSAVNNSLKKIEKFVGEADAEVKLGAKGSNIKRCKVELTVRWDKNVVRVEAVDMDMYAAISTAESIAVARIKKIKGKMKKKAGKSIRDDKFQSPDFKVEEDIDLDFVINREKIVNAESMTREEACIEMEFTDHSFYVFRDVERNDELEVMYKRHDGGYGLLKIEE